MRRIRTGLTGADWLIALLIVVLVVPLDKLAAGNASVQVATTVSGTVVMLARLVFAHFKS